MAPNGLATSTRSREIVDNFGTGARISDVILMAVAGREVGIEEKEG